MSKVVELTAKTVEEAVSLANAQYADANHEISYEILEMPKKGFLGIGAKKAKIKVTVTKTSPVDLGSLVNDIKGMKNITDRGSFGNDREEKKESPKNKSPEKQNNDRRDQDRQRNNHKFEDKKNHNRDNQKKHQNQRREEVKQSSPQQNQAEKPKAEETQKPKTKLNNQGLPGKRGNRPQIKKSMEKQPEPSSVTVNRPAVLSEFKSDYESSGAFGTSRVAAGGKMSNDAKKNRKNAISQSTSQKHDISEKEDDYLKAERLASEQENMLDERASELFGETMADDSDTAVPKIPAAKEAVTEAEMNFALDFVAKLISNMKLNAEARAAEKPEGEELITTETATVYPKINIVGEDSSVLIGHHGETLDAIQYLVNLSALRRTKSGDGDYVKIVVDVENYREKRESTLRSLAKRMAAKAVKYKRNVYLEPMNAYERRIIHSELQSFPNVSTHSVGSDRDRKIIVTYEGSDKVSYRNRSGKSDSRKKGDKKKSQSSGQGEWAGEPLTYNPERKPKKIQKVPLDKLTEYLEGNETATIITDEDYSE
jgi:spoIIIJ-associated protein